MVAMHCVLCVGLVVALIARVRMGLQCVSVVFTDGGTDCAVRLTAPTLQPWTVVGGLVVLFAIDGLSSATSK